MIRYKDNISFTNVKKIYEVFLNFFKRNKQKQLLYSFRIFKMDTCRRLDLSPDEEDFKYLENQKFKINMKVVLNHPHFHILEFRQSLETIKARQQDLVLKNKIQEYVYRGIDRRFYRLFIEYYCKTGDFALALEILENLKSLNEGIDQHFFKTKWVLISLRLGEISDWKYLVQIIDDYLCEPDFMAEVLQIIIKKKFFRDEAPVTNDSARRHSESKKKNITFQVGQGAWGSGGAGGPGPEIDISMFSAKDTNNANVGNYDIDNENFGADDDESFGIDEIEAVGDEDSEFGLDKKDTGLREGKLVELILKHLLLQEPVPNFWKCFHRLLKNHPNFLMCFRDSARLDEEYGINLFNMLFRKTLIEFRAVWAGKEYDLAAKKSWIYRAKALAIVDTSKGDLLQKLISKLLEKV